MQIIRYILYATGAAFWGLAIYVLLKIAVQAFARTCSLTRWVWRISSDASPTVGMIPGAWWSYFKEQAFGNVTEYHIGKSHWRGVGDWNIEPETRQPE